MLMKRLALGTATYIPGVSKFTNRSTGGSISARYCYSVWLRHLTMMHRHGLPTQIRNVAELGPGDSLGIGLTALLTGAERYYAFDVKPHASVERNLAVFDSLVDLFQRRSDIPGPDEFPGVRPELNDHAFPAKLFPDAHVERLLHPDRVARIRDSLRNWRDPQSIIHYVAPWIGTADLERGSMDLIFSQAVMEHVEALPEAYDTMFQWLRPGGAISHEIDFKSHQTATEWNGHWTYPDWLWKLIRGRRLFLINREPCSTHLRLVRDAGFELIAGLRDTRPSNLPRSKLAHRFRQLSEEDLVTATALVLARKPA